MRPKRKLDAHAKSEARCHLREPHVSFRSLERLRGTAMCAAHLGTCNNSYSSMDSLVLLGFTEDSQVYCI